MHIVQEPEFSRKNGRVRFLVSSCWSCMPSFRKILGAVLQEYWWPTTNYGRTIQTLTSTVVENCNVLKDLLNVSDLLRPQWPPSTSLIRWINRVYLSVVSKYAISSQSGAPRSKKWPYTSFLAMRIIQKGIFEIVEWSSMVHTMATSSRPLSSIKICNIKSNQWIKLKKMAKNLIFCSFLHNLCTLCILN